MRWKIQLQQLLCIRGCIFGLVFFEHFLSYPSILKVTRNKTKRQKQKSCREKTSVTMAIFSYYGNLLINLAFICLFEVVFIETEHHDNQIDLKIFHKKFMKTQNAQNSR